MPASPLPEITLPAPRLLPPIVFPGEPSIRIPSSPLPTAAVPAALTPSLSAWMRFPPFCSSVIADPENPSIATPWTRLFPPEIVRPLTWSPAWLPSSTIRGVQRYPGWLVPSIVTGAVKRW